MPLARRVQLAPPGLPKQHSAALGGDPKHAALPATGKRSAAAAAEDDSTALLSPPPLIKRQLVLVAPLAAAVAPSPAITNLCATGCLRHPEHVGLCHTADGPAPPSIKRAWRRCKALAEATWQYRADSSVDDELEEAPDDDDDDDDDDDYDGVCTDSDA